MANISAYLQKQILDWSLKGGTGTQPANIWVGLAIGTPTSVTGSEIQANSGYARQTGLFGAAASPAGSASNTASINFGPFSSTQSILGIHIWDGSPINSSNLLFHGTLQNARTVQPGDTIVVQAGALVITLS